MSLPPKMNWLSFSGLGSFFETHCSKRKALSFAVYVKGSRSGPCALLHFPFHLLCSLKPGAVGCLLQVLSDSSLMVSSPSSWGSSGYGLSVSSVVSVSLGLIFRASVPLISALIPIILPVCCSGGFFALFPFSKLLRSIIKLHI